MKTLKHFSPLVIPALFLALLSGGCVSKSRHLKVMSEKDLLLMQLQEEHDKNAALERAKKSLKERLAEMGRKTGLSEQEQSRRIAALEAAKVARDKEIEALKALLGQKKQDVQELQGLLAAESLASENIKKRLLEEKDAASRNEQVLKKKLEDGKGRIEALRKAISEKARKASLLQQRLAKELQHSEARKRRLEEIKRLAEVRKRKLEETAKTSEALIKQLQDQIEQGNVVISRMKNRLSVQIVNRVLFASGSTQVSKKGKEILKDVSKVLKGVKGNTIRIEGHTDNVPISTSLSARFPSNWELSTARATQVVRYLIEEEVDPQNLMAAGVSQYDPVAPNDSPEGRQMNRRIEIILAPKEKSS